MNSLYINVPVLYGNVATRLARNQFIKHVLREGARNLTDSCESYNECSVIVVEVF